MIRGEVPLWTLSEPYLEIIIRTVIVYRVILIGIRLTGKREVGRMTPSDPALLLLISNAVQHAMIGFDTSVIGAAGPHHRTKILVEEELVAKGIQR